MTTNRDWLFSLPLDDQIAWMNAEHQDGTLDGDTDALNAKIAELTAERDNLAKDLAMANNERERYRRLLGKALDYADAIHALADEGLA